MKLNWIPKPRSKLPRLILFQGDIYMNGKKIDDKRIGCGVLNYTRYCGCGNCDSCLIGKVFLNESAN